MEQNKTEAEIKAESAKLDIKTYIMTYHNIRWSLINNDLNKLNCIGQL